MAFLVRAFEAVSQALDLPPRIQVETDLGLVAEEALVSPEVEERLWLFGRIAAARHAPRARFLVCMGGVLQQASAWLEGGSATLREVFREDLGIVKALLERVRIPLGHGDAKVEVLLSSGLIRMEARDVGALELLELASSAATNGDLFSGASTTFQEASQTPSRAAARERSQVEQENLGLRTGHLLGDSTLSMDELVQRLGVARIRSYLEDPRRRGLAFSRRLEALGALPSPGRAKAIVRLLLESRGVEGFPSAPWLAHLVEEPRVAACRGLEDLILQGYPPTELCRFLSRLDPERTPLALAQAIYRGGAVARQQATEVLVSFGVEVAAAALAPVPETRVGLEACWSVASRLLEEEDRTLSSLLTALQENVQRLVDQDPAAAWLAGEIARARGDLEGALSYFEDAATRSQDRSLVARVNLATASLALQMGRPEEAIRNLLCLARETSGQDRREAFRNLRLCFSHLKLEGFAALCEGLDGAREDWCLNLVEAWLEGHRENNEKAVRLFEACHRAYPVSGEVARAYAATLRKIGRSQDAIVLLERDCQGASGDLESRYQLALALYETDQEETVLQHIDLGLSMDAHHPGLLHLKGLVCERQERFEEAACCFEGALDGEKNLPTACRGLARSYIATERYEEAARVYRSLAVGPALEQPVFRELGRLYEEDLGDREQALYWYQRHLTQCGEDPEVLKRFDELASEMQTFSAAGVGRGGS
jgi:tetratricopeptide (TPR) repeat protein